MKSEECVIWGTFFIGAGRPRPEFGRWLLDSIPTAWAPQYFSDSELLRRSSRFEVANAGALSLYLGSRSSYFFHAAAYELSVGTSFGDRKEIEVYGRSLLPVCQMLTAWIPVLDRDGLYYATAGVPDEYEHRNGASVVLKDGRGGTGHLWFGRDYRRYVPGLYWLNYFSREFLAKHEIDLVRLAERTGAKVQELTNGHLVQLYDSPLNWRECSERIDDVLATTPNFFTIRSVPVPESVYLRDTVTLIADLGRKWP